MKSLAKLIMDNLIHVEPTKNWRTIYPCIEIQEPEVLEPMQSEKIVEEEETDLSDKFNVNFEIK